jgi:PKD repeat protein
VSGDWFTAYGTAIGHFLKVEVNDRWLHLDAIDTDGNVFDSYEMVKAVPIAPSIITQPADQTVVEGQTATFSVVAEGTEPLFYQWQRDGDDIPGATGATYTTPGTTLADDGATFRCIVTNAVGSVTSDAATLTVTAAGPRVTDGQVVLYTFEEGSGTTVSDVSGVGMPLDLSVDNAAAVSWVAGGLVINGPTIVASAGPATKVIDGSQASNELTIEAWVKPASTTQMGTVRIVTLSSDRGHRNFTLEQGLWGDQPSDRYAVRLRTTTSSDNGRPTLNTPHGSLTTDLTHVVYTRDASGEARIYVNGVERASGTVGGDFSNWDGNYRLALANELTEDRPWLGEFHLVAIYNRALSQAEVSQNLAAGPNGSGNQAPVASFTADPLSGDAPLTVSFDATASSDPDGTIVAYDWDLRDGSTGTGVTISHEYTLAGTYPVTLTVTDDGGATDSATTTITVSVALVPPSIITHPADQSVTEGQTATFSVVAEGTESLFYQWQKNGVDIAGATSAAYTTPETTLADDGATFRCIVTNAAGSVTSDAATLTVLEVINAAIDIEKTPETQTVVSGEDAHFTLTVSNPGDVELSNVVVTDAQCDVLTGPSGDDGDGVLQTSETWV